MSESEEPRGLSRRESHEDLILTEADALWESVDLSDRLDAHDREGRKRLGGALVTTVVGPTGLGLLVFMNRDAASLSSIAFLAALPVVLLVAAWGWWGLFACSDLAKVRREAGSDRLLGE